jgi:phage shock protein PspC (stress-responsive transcriptional regulator)
MVLADAATTSTVGLLVTFVGIGIIVNGILVYIAAQIIVERRQNQDLREGN